MGVYEFWSSASGVWFVDTATGNNTTGNGSPTSPYKTVAKAYTIASNGHKLYIKAGNYGTDKLPTLPRMTKSLRLFNWLDIGLSRIGKPGTTWEVRRAQKSLTGSAPTPNPSPKIRERGAKTNALNICTIWERRVNADTRSLSAFYLFLSGYLEMAIGKFGTDGGFAVVGC